MSNPIQLKAKYAGKCQTCGGKFSKGAEIIWQRGYGSQHLDCADRPSFDPEAEDSQEDLAAGLEPGTLATDRRLARRGLTVIRFASGASYTQNSRGKCEDAPCCGCCTF